MIMSPKPLDAAIPNSNSCNSEQVDFSRPEAVESMLLTSQHSCSDDVHCMKSQDFQELRLLPGNTQCVDCGSADPDWASVTLGIFMCLQCSGQHRYVKQKVKTHSRPYLSWGILLFSYHVLQPSLCFFRT